MQKIISVLSFLIAVALCFCCRANAEQATDANSIKTHGKTLSAKEVKNAILRLAPWESGSPDTFVKLKNGNWAKDQDEVSMTDVALGDLNKDGITDAAAIYYTSGGGTGRFFNVTALVNKNGRLMAVDNKVLGDRVGVRGLRISKGVIIADVISHRSTDGANFPTVNRTARYTLKGGKLLGPESMY